MNDIRLVTLLLCAAIAVAGCSTPETQEFDPLVELPSEDGTNLLLAASETNDHWELSRYFITQDNLAFCGVASSVMVLNALEINKPVSSRHQPYHLFTQEDFFDAETDRVVTREAVSTRGMVLEELGGLLRAKGASVTVEFADRGNLDAFRTAARRILADDDAFVLVNYKRAVIGQKTGGHISPISAYNQKIDRFLILDVSRYKYPPVWVEAEDLWRAMLNVDTDSGRSRGYVIVSAR